MSRFTTCISCECGARYERAEAHLPVKDIGIYECSHCGCVLERWHGRTVPEFKLVHTPEQKSSSAA